MLTPAEQTLIAAFIDGEMSAPEVERVRTLLAESPAALELHGELLADRARLQRLPVLPAPATLRAAVMARIQAMPIQPVVVPKPAPHAPLPRRMAWIPYAVAASFLLIVSGGSYYLIGQQASRVTVARQARSLPDIDESPAVRAETPVVVASRVADARREQAIANAGEGRPAVDPQGVATASEITKPNDQILASPILDMPKLNAVSAQLPVLLSLAELSRDDAKNAITAELSTDGVMRIDLFARDAFKAVDAVVAAGKGVGLSVAVEPLAQERLKKRVPSSWMIYSESLTATEIIALLANLAAIDEKAAAQSPSNRNFGSIHVIAGQAAELKDVKDLVGIDLSKKARADSGPKAVSAGTIDEISVALQKSKDKSGLLLTYLPANVRMNPASSKEIKLYLDRRGVRKAGSIAVMLVVRNSNG